jgi:hypothetical protein
VFGGNEELKGEEGGFTTEDTETDCAKKNRFAVALGSCRDGRSGAGPYEERTGL